MCHINVVVSRINFSGAMYFKIEFLKGKTNLIMYVYLWSADKGSFKVTGIEIFDKSFPIFLQSKFHKLRPDVSGLTAGNFCLRPVIRVKVELPGLTTGMTLVLPVRGSYKIIFSTGIRTWNLKIWSPSRYHVSYWHFH